MLTSADTAVINRLYRAKLRLNCIEELVSKPQSVNAIDFDGTATEIEVEDQGKLLVIHIPVNGCDSQLSFHFRSHKRIEVFKSDLIPPNRLF